MQYELAQVNYSRLRASLDSPLLTDFVDSLGPVNAAADSAPGFVWRLQSDSGNATDIAGFAWDVGDSVGVIVNMSVWTGVAELAEFVYGELHRQVLRRRREWFEHLLEATTVCWWVPAGERPSVADAEDRILLLRAHGPSPDAFTLQQHFPPPGDGAAQPLAGSDDWLCPA